MTDLSIIIAKFMVRQKTYVTWAAHPTGFNTQAMHSAFDIWTAALDTFFANASPEDQALWREVIFPAMNHPEQFV